MITTRLRFCCLLLILAGLVAFLGSCATHQSAGIGVTPTAAIPLATPIITGNAEGAPDGCSVETVADRLMDLATAVNHTDENAAGEFFGKGSMEWFCTVEDGEPFTAYTTDELEAHFQRRYAQHEQWQVESIQFNGWERARGLIHFGPVIIWRTADDLSAPFQALGKGAYSCARQQFVVLCLGGETETAR